MCRKTRRKVREIIYYGHHFNFELINVSKFKSDTPIKFAQGLQILDSRLIEDSCLSLERTLDIGTLIMFFHLPSI